MNTRRLSLGLLNTCLERARERTNRPEPYIFVSQQRYEWYCQHWPQMVGREGPPAP